MTPERPLFSDHRLDGKHKISRREVLLGLGLGPPALVADHKLRRLQKPLEVLVKTPEPEVSLEGRKRLVFVSGLAESLSSDGPGNKLFAEFKRRLEKDDYEGQDFIDFSWGKTCEDTLTDPKIRAEVLANFIISWFKQHPNDKLVVLTHSEAVQPALFLMEKVRAGEFDIDPAKVDFIMTHATALGVNKPGLGLLARLFPFGCRIGASPSPHDFAEPAGENLLSTWENRKARSVEIEKTVSWWREKGSRVRGVGNYQDLAISLRYGWLPLGIWQTLFFLNLIPEIVQTQEVPGAENYVLPLGFDRDGLGHDRAWTTDQGLDLLEMLVGKQEKITPQETAELLQAPSWRGVIPGRTTLAELNNLLGPPASSKREDGIIHLTFERLGKAREDEVFVENNIVILVKEKVSDRYLIAYQNKYGKPEGEYWGTAKESGFKTFIYAKEGLAVVASLGDGAILEVWYFKPVGLKQFLSSRWGKELLVEWHSFPHF